MSRKLLASILVIGLIGAIAAGSTSALLNETESSNNNTFAAGSFDLKVDWTESYNGEVVEEQNFTDNPGSILQLQDVKPGDEGEATISLHLFGNPGFVWMNMTQTANYENGCTEPEAEVDDSCGNPGSGEGELGENLYFTIWQDDGDNTLDSGEEVLFNGTADELQNQRILIGDSNTNSSGQGLTTLNESATRANNSSELEPETQEELNLTGEEVNKSNQSYVNDTEAIEELNYSDNMTEEATNVTEDKNNITEEEANVSKNQTQEEIDQLGGAVAEAELQPIPNSTTQYIGVKWWVPIEVGNEIQTDTKEFDLGFQAVQARHNPQGEFPERPPAGNVTPPTGNVTPPENVTFASVNFENQTSNGSSVVVDEVNTSDGGFVAILNQQGDVLGATDFIAPGVESDLGIDLSPPINMSQTLTAQVHEDTNDNQQLDFLTSNGTEDTPYTENGTPVTDDAFITLNETNVTPPDNVTNVTASVNFENQTSNGSSVVVDEVNTSDGGFVAILNGSGDVLGATSYLDPGQQNDLIVSLSPPINMSQFLTAQVHEDTNDNQQLDFLTSNGTEDTPYTEDGTPVTDDAFITVNETNVTPPDNQTNATLAAIGNVALCVNGTQQGDNPCPEGEAELVRYEWNGTAFEAENDTQNTTIEATEFQDEEETEPIEAFWTSEQFIETAVVESAGESCSFPGGFNGTVTSCGPPTTPGAEETNLSFTADLQGENEVPPVETNATGNSSLNVTGEGVEYSLMAQDIENVTQAHIHVGGPDENGPVVAFLANYTATTSGEGGTPEDGPINESGTVSEDDLVGPLENETLENLTVQMQNDNAYVNIHTVQNPDGEIRGQTVEENTTQ